MVTGQLNLNGDVRHTIQTSNHRFLVNEAGVLVYDAGPDTETGDLGRSEAKEFQFAEVLALADFVEKHRDDLIQAQVQLEQTWRTVADELIDLFESREPGSTEEISGEEIHRLILDDLEPITFHGFGTGRSFAARWYQSLWTPDSYPTTFGQQWVPFLRTFHQRCCERFPERYLSE